MKKTGSFGSRSTTSKKQPEAKSSSLGRTAKVGLTGGINATSASFNRRSPVVTDQTIATNSVIQAAADPKIKELVMKQQQIFRESQTPRNRESRDGLGSAHNSVDHPASSHHTSHQQQAFWKHASFAETEVTSGNDFVPEMSHGKYVVASPELHVQQQHYYHQPLTPGSAVETVVHHEHAQDDDGANSELTADAGYMTLQRSAGPSLPPTAERPSSISPNAAPSAVSGSSPSTRGHHMHMFMDLNASLLNEHHAHGAHGAKDPYVSPSMHSMAHYGLPMPPPLSLPQASNMGIANTDGFGAPANTPMHAAGSSKSAASVVVDPKELDDDALRAAYMRFMVEMETRGLHSLSLHPSGVTSHHQCQQSGPPFLSNAQNALLLSSSSSCAGAGPGSGPSSNGVQSSRNDSPSPAAVLAFADREGNYRTAQSALTPKSTSHSAGVASLPPHLNPNTNPVDIRKNVHRSRSGGSESAFYPNQTLPAGAGSFSTAPNGRKTPNSPLMGRYMHSGGAFTGEVAHEELHNWAPSEPEDAELRKAFGQYRHPGSPSYPAYSPFHHLSSGAPQPSYYTTAHGAGAAGHGAGAYHTGATPTSVAAGSVNINPAGAVLQANLNSHTTTSATAAAAAERAAYNALASSRSVSRCSGVVPQNLHDDLPASVRNNCLSTLPQTHSQYMHTQTPATSAGTHTSSSAAASPRSVDLKTPKFVRKFQGMGAGLLGLTSQRYANIEEGDDSSSSMEVDALAPAAPAVHSAGKLRHSGAGSAGNGSASTVQVGGPGKQQQGGVSGHAGSAHGASGSAVGGSSKSSTSHHKDEGTSGSTTLRTPSSEFDAVKQAGGFDQLLLPGRLLNKRQSSLIPDEHSAFDDCTSVGSMSLNSARSGGKKSAKTR